jgi:LacI family transcriptional regulator
VSANRPSVTIKDVANLLGLAHTTVSRALNDHPKISQETKDRVRATADRLGYITNLGARSMRVGSSKLVGLIVPDVQNEFYGAAARAMAQHCAQHGYQMMLGVSEDDPQREEMHVRSLREARAAGVLIVPCSAPTPTSIALLRQLPTVQFLRSHAKLGQRSVLADDLDGVASGTEHLLALGHRRIGFIGGSTDISTGRGRLAGYESALRRRGLTIDPSLVQVGPPQPGFGAQAIEALLEQAGGVTALIVASSRQLLGVLQAARRLQVDIPGSLSLVAYGDADWFEVSQPSITAISLPVAAMCERATRALFDRVESATPTRKSDSVFPTQLVVRASTARPQAAAAARVRKAQPAGTRQAAR